MTVSSKKTSVSNGLLELKNKLKKDESIIITSKVSKIETVTSNSWVFDYVSGIGGAPIGRMIEFNGKEASGKTTLALMIAAQSQKMGMHVLYFDAENALDTVYAHKLGLSFDEEKLTLIGCKGIETIDSIFTDYCKLGIPTLFILDSLPATVPEQFLTDPSVERKNPGLHSRLQGSFLNRATTLLARTNSTMIVLNQMRANMDIARGPAAYAAPKEKSAGGHASKHFQSQIFHLQLAGKEKEDIEDVLEGSKVKKDSVLKIKITNRKNKVGRPFLGGMLYMNIGEGFDNMRNLIEAAINRKIITKKTGGWYYSKLFIGGDETKIQGTKKLSNYLRENESVVEAILQELKWIQPDGRLDLSGEYGDLEVDPTAADEEDDTPFPSFSAQDDED